MYPIHSQFTYMCMHCVLLYSPYIAFNIENIDARQLKSSFQIIYRNLYWLEEFKLLPKLRIIFFVISFYIFFFLFLSLLLFSCEWVQAGNRNRDTRKISFSESFQLKKRDKYVHRLRFFISHSKTVFSFHFHFGIYIYIFSSSFLYIYALPLPGAHNFHLEFEYSQTLQYMYLNFYILQSLVRAFLNFSIRL